MVLTCLPSDALSQHLPSYLGFSYLGHGVSLHGCSSKVQSLLLTLNEGYLLSAAPPDLECGVAPLGPPAPVVGEYTRTKKEHHYYKEGATCREGFVSSIRAMGFQGAQDDDAGDEEWEKYE